MCCGLGREGQRTMKTLKAKMGSTWSLKSYQASLLDSPVHTSITKGEYYRNDDPNYTPSPRNGNKFLCSHQGGEKLSVRGYDNLCYFPNEDSLCFNYDDEVQSEDRPEYKSDTEYDSHSDTLSILKQTTKSLRRTLSLRQASFRFRRKKKEVPPKTKNPIIYSSVLKNYDINYYPSETKIDI